MSQAVHVRHVSCPKCGGPLPPSAGACPNCILGPVPATGGETDRRAFLVATAKRGLIALVSAAAGLAAIAALDSHGHLLSLYDLGTTIRAKEWVVCLLCVVFCAIVSHPRRWPRATWLSQVLIGEYPAAPVIEYGAVAEGVGAGILFSVALLIWCGVGPPVRVTGGPGLSAAQLQQHSGEIAALYVFIGVFVVGAVGSILNRSLFRRPIPAP